MAYPTFLQIAVFYLEVVSFSLLNLLSVRRRAWLDFARKSGDAYAYALAEYLGPPNATHSEPAL